MSYSSFIKKLILSLCGLMILPAWGYANSVEQKNQQPDIVAYVLLNSPSDVTTLKTTLDGYNNKYPFTQLDISFMSPTMSPTNVSKDINSNDYDQLLVDSLFSVDGKSPYTKEVPHTGADLQSLIKSLRNSAINVYFSVGGWGYSSGGQAANVTTFPLTTDILKNIQQYKSSLKLSMLQANDDTVGVHTALDTYTTADLAKTWIQAAEAFGANGIDLDYEEQWFPAQVHTMLVQSGSPDVVPGHSWSFHNNFSTIKYAAYIQSLENNAPKDFSISIAAPAVGAFNVNAVVSGDIYAGNFFYPSGKAAPLKGVIYNMLHPADAGLNNLAIFVNSKKINIINGLSSVGVMSYDLDDGDVDLTSYWCLGWQQSQGQSLSSYPIARDPTGDGGHTNVSCSVYDQVLAIANSFNQLGINTNNTKINMGIEAYYPNYPINPHVTDSATPAYRWNDPFVVFDLPLIKPLDSSLEQLPFTMAGGSDKNKNPDQVQYSHFWLVPSQLAQDIKSKNDGMIFWSINNAESTIYAQDVAAQSTTPSAFAKYSTHISDMITPLLSDVASWKDILNQIYAVYYPPSHKLKTK